MIFGLGMLNFAWQFPRDLTYPKRSKDRPKGACERPKRATPAVHPRNNFPRPAARILVWGRPIR